MQNVIRDLPDLLADLSDRVDQECSGVFGEQEFPCDVAAGNKGPSVLEIEATHAVCPKDREGFGKNVVAVCRRPLLENVEQIPVVKFLPAPLESSLELPPIAMEDPLGDLNALDVMRLCYW